MRELGFAKHWSKLDNDSFTTFRLPRRDRDWHVGEAVTIVLGARSKNKVKLGKAEIISKMPAPALEITEEEAIADGFTCREEMLVWIRKAHDLSRLRSETLNKLTLQYFEKHGR